MQRTENCRELRIQRYCRCRSTSRGSGSVGQSRQLTATSPCSPQELSVGSPKGIFGGKRRKRKRVEKTKKNVQKKRSKLFSLHFMIVTDVTDSQVVSVLNKVMLEDRFANALKQPKLKPLKPLVKESRDAELVCTNLPDMLGPWVLRQEPLR